MGAIFEKFKGKFELGRTVMTAGVQASIGPDDLLNALRRFADGDWGDLDAEDKAANDRGLASGQDRLMGVYKAKDGTVFWIITEWDRSVTTFLFPSEY